tara:strand:+ start:243 stop:635 length:393 start_codon:yes stop_codon:yes gene_type:complete
MAVHAYTGVTGKITVSGSIVGFVSGDFTLAAATGKYVTLGSNIPIANTRGLRSSSGTLKKAWGIADTDLYSWLNGDTELDITFDPDNGTSNRYTISGCVLTDMAIEGLEAGSEGALMINASFEGLNWSRA